METQEFVRSRTERCLSGKGVSESQDNVAYRQQLVERFTEIQAEVSCEHSPGEGYLLADAILNLSVRGPVVECGCFQGGMTAKLSIVCADTARELYICDSFDGLPEPVHEGGRYRHFDSRADVIERFGKIRHFKRGEYRANLQEVAENVRRLGCLQVCRFVPGLFADTLPLLKVDPALVTIDVDLIESARDCLRSLWPRLKGSRFFTHEAFIETYMNGLLEPAWWTANLSQGVPEVIGIATGINPVASCTAVLIKGDRK